MRQRRARPVRFAEAGGKGKDSPALDETHKRVDRTSDALSLPPPRPAFQRIPPNSHAPGSKCAKRLPPVPARCAPSNCLACAFAGAKKIPHQPAWIGPEQKLPVGATDLTEGLGRTVAQYRLEINQSVTRSPRRRVRAERAARQGVARSLSSC